MRVNFDFFTPSCRTLNFGFHFFRILLLLMLRRLRYMWLITQRIWGLLLLVKVVVVAVHVVEGRSHKIILLCELWSVVEVLLSIGSIIIVPLVGITVLLLRLTTIEITCTILTLHTIIILPINLLILSYFLYKFKITCSLLHTLLILIVRFCVHQ